MGLPLRDLVHPKQLTVNDLSGKVLAVDTFNLLYQFLATIRGPDGTPLTNPHGAVTSHLVGIFSRTTTLLQKQIKLVFVFDGKPPLLKTKERDRRRLVKEQAQEAYEVAKEREDLSAMKKYAARTTILTSQMIEDAKELITALGLPIVQAPSEGEAQVAHMVKTGAVEMGVSQDYDALLYGIPRLVRNLSLTGKRKKAGIQGYDKIEPELLQIADVLNNLGIDQDQLIVLAILIGTDYNRSGIKGIGPKTALKLVKQYGKSFDALFTEVHWDEQYDFSWQLIYECFKTMPVTDEHHITFKRLDAKKVMQVLCDKHDFSRERTQLVLDKIEKTLPSQTQKGLGEFFG